jgi:hypothetical protein
MSVNQFISHFSRWGYEGGLSPLLAKKLPGTLRNIVQNELPINDVFVQLWIREITNTTNLNCRMVTSDVCCSPDKSIYASVVIPNWRNGMRKICKDEELYQAVSWFFHFASQYIGRSRLANLVGAIALTFNQATDFRGKMTQMTCDNSELAIQLAIEQHLGQIEISTRGRERVLKAWCDLINSLDPFIHRMIFNYVRAVDLFKNDFYEEAMTALDSTVNVAEQFVRERLGVSEQDQRLATARILGLSRHHTEQLKFLYNIRCYFGAHPSLSKWWDFSELYANEFDDLFDAVKQVIYHTCVAENHNRVVDKLPSTWSSWFNQNAVMLWKSVWFSKLPGRQGII